MQEMTVRIPAGEIRGRVDDGVAVFLGVPYAAPPVGEHRLGAPAAVAPWEGVRDALTLGPTTPAPGYPAEFSELLPAPVVLGDDYLHVNVWAPDGARDRPVMVWIHGGAFVNGNNAVPNYDGTAFARDGVVLVAVNYRLGAEGFLHLPDAVPNRGLLDQVAALTWVRDAIAAFGGDPGNVTVFGESAGAMSIGALLAMPAACGLFHRAVLQSGAGHHALTAATASRVAGYAAQQLGTAPTRDALARVPAPDLLAVQTRLSAEAATAPDPGRWGEIAANGMVFEPVVDGVVLPTLPIEAADPPSVEVMIGWNRDEHRLFLVPGGRIDTITEPVLRSVVAAYGLPDGAVDAYRVERPEATAGEVLCDVMSDFFFRIPAVRLAERVAQAHVYEFDWATPVLGGRLGACHALELGFVFDTLEASRGLVGDSPPQGLADAMHRAWVAFATTGDPGWTAYGAARHVLRFTADTAVTEVDPRAVTRELWSVVR